jgi:hypothetical protein
MSDTMTRPPSVTASAATAIEVVFDPVAGNGADGCVGRGG